MDLHEIYTSLVFHYLNIIDQCLRVQMTSVKEEIPENRETGERENLRETNEIQNEPERGEINIVPCTDVKLKPGQMVTLMSYRKILLHVHQRHSGCC